MKQIFIAFILITLFLPASHAAIIDNGNGTVTDTRTGLTWQQATATQKNWENALDYCTNLSLNGHNDWRLPSLNELESIIDYNEYNPAIDPDAFAADTESGKYWSSTTYYSTRSSAWHVDFNSGSIS